MSKYCPPNLSISNLSESTINSTYSTHLNVSQVMKHISCAKCIYWTQWFEIQSGLSYTNQKVCHNTHSPHTTYGEGPTRFCAHSQINVWNNKPSNIPISTACKLQQANSNQVIIIKSTMNESLTALLEDI